MRSGYRLLFFDIDETLVATGGGRGGVEGRALPADVAGTRLSRRRPPLYLGDDITDEDAFRALRGRGIGIIVDRPDDPEVANPGSSPPS